MRVFVIGLPKTGTTSMAAALKRLGLKQHYVHPMEFFRTGRLKLPKGHFLCERAQRHYWWFHRLYPDAKFILMYRNEAEWLASLEKHMPRIGGDSERKNVRRVSVLGLTEFNRDFHREWYWRHNTEVVNHFHDAGAADQLLMHTLGKHGYAELCDFLGVPHVNEPWPHENKAP